MDASSQEKILGYFIEEAKEHLETLEKGILELSSVIDDDETINEMFRAAHSIKGGGAMLGYTSIQKTAHRLEDAFKVLRDEKVAVDQKLETLFLEGYDVLQDLVMRLQGPVGLPDEEGLKVFKQAEPTFVDLQNYLNQLRGGEAKTSAETPPTAATPSEDRGTQVRKLLKQMLTTFKQEPTSQGRQQLQSYCDSLAKLASGEKGWKRLLDTAKKAIANPQHSFRTLAPVVIKELKMGSDYLELGKTGEISPSSNFEHLATTSLPYILVSLEPKKAATTLKGVFNQQQLSELSQLLKV